MRTPQVIHELIDRFPVTRRWGPAYGTGVLLLLAAILVVVVIVVLGHPGTHPAAAYGAITQRGPFAVTLIESGEIAAAHEIIISAPMVWDQRLQVTELVPEGTQVNAGDFLMQFDITSLLASRILAEDELASLKASFERTAAQQSLKMSDLDNSLMLARYAREEAILRLRMRQFESASRREQARLHLKQAEIDLERLQKQVEFQRVIHASKLAQESIGIRQAENKVGSIQERLAKLRLTSPTDGLVVYQEVGRWNSRERLRDGYIARPGEALLAIPDLTRMQIKLYLNEVDWWRIKVGQRARLTLDAYPDQSFQGEVREVAKLAQSIWQRSRLKGFVVYVDIEGTDPSLKPGMTAKVEIVLEELQDAVFAPIGAVFEVAGQPVVFPQGSSEPHAVHLGQRTDGFVVIERGIGAGVKLSWFDPSGETASLGTADEERRVRELGQAMAESFAIFEERGILYNYSTERDSAR